MRLPVSLAWSVLALGVSVPVAAQDVELLGRIYGTEPPAGYYERLQSRGDFFRFERGWRGSDRMLDRVAGDRLGGRASIHPPIEGTFRFPVILGLYADTDAPPFAREALQRELFDGPNARGPTISEFYDEISGGRVDVLGETFAWRRVTLTEVQVAGGESGLGAGSRVGELILQLLAGIENDGGTDWGRYDNDGPDGIPNSGDDDGFVDVLSIVHPNLGGECSAPGREDRVWSHRATLQEAVGQTFVTDTPSAAGGWIRVDDYTIQPAISCDRVSMNEIGVFAHELGHGFGLPDLYATGDVDHNGIGNWGLMGTGAFGCDSFTPERPCHMSAWSKSVLGWADVQLLDGEGDRGIHTLPPVESSETIFRIDARDGSGLYYLLENRRAVGSDLDLFEQGLLIYQIDPDVVDERWASNSVNRSANRMGVWIRQADGSDHLARAFGGRGDAGDPFPGATGATAFHAGSTPSARSFAGEATGVTLTEIEEVGDEIRFRLGLGFRTVTLVATGLESVDPASSAFAVDGVALPGHIVDWVAAPFERRVVTAAPGIEISDGVRIGFDGWRDGSERVHEFVVGPTDETRTARYGPRQVRLALTLVATGAGTNPSGVAPADVVVQPASPDGWFPEGASATVTLISARGFLFREWSGDLTGAGPVAQLTLDAPRNATATFEVTFGFVGLRDPMIMTGGTPTEEPVLVSNGVGPIVWSVEGTLPEGIELDPGGRLVGAPLVSGIFPVEVSARDARGLEVTTSTVLRVRRPTLAEGDLLAPFLLKPSGLTPDQERYLDRSGNRNGVFDLGDARAHLLAVEAAWENGGAR